MAYAKRHTILLLGNYRPTLALARTLSKEGHRIIVGLEGCDGGAEFSRFTDLVFDHPHLNDGEESFLSALEAFVKENGVTVIFPVAEEYVRVFVKHRDRVSALPPIAMVDPDLVAQCLDKPAMMERCVKLKVPCAPFAMVHDREAAREAIDRLGLPLVVRPERSTQRLDGKKALSLYSGKDTKHLFDVWAHDEGGLILQSRFEGRRYNVYFAADNGKLFRHLQAVILRTDNPDGSGLAVEGKTIEPLPALKDYTERLVGELSYTGVGCAQFLVNDLTGAVSFLEINARIAGNLIVAEEAGLRLSTILPSLALKEPIDQTFIEGRTGMRYVWVTGEMMAAIVNQSRGEIGLLEMTKRCARAFFTGLNADLHMVFLWRDPLPAIVTMIRLMPSFSGIKRRVKALFGASPKANRHQEQVS
ncbi:MAG: hypothetical protein AAGE89_16120 [Pseudomonadota bacterium]